MDYSTLTNIVTDLENLAQDAETIANSLTTEVLEVSSADLSNVKDKFTDAAKQLRSAKGTVSSKGVDLKNQESTILGT